MRLVQGKPSPDDSFSSFACSASPLPSKRPAGQADRVPDKDFMTQMTRLPKAATKRKKIVVSEDEEEISPSPAKAMRASGRSGISDGRAAENADSWLDVRDPRSLSAEERGINVQAAMQDRKDRKNPTQSVHIKNYKRAPTVMLDDDEDEIEEVTPKKANKLPADIFKKQKNGIKKNCSNSKLIDSILNDDGALEDHSRGTGHEDYGKREREERNNARRQKSETSAQVPTKKDVQKNTKKIDLSGDTDEAGVANDESSEDGGWEDGERSKNDELTMAKEILRNCENVSINLRKSLRQWEQGDEDGSNDDNNNEEDGDAKSNSGVSSKRGAVKNCIDLVSIKSPAGPSSSSSSNGKVSGGTEPSQVLRDEDIECVCPGLRLKPYQLVGVNWLKLLLINNINGVLADDMGLGKTIQTIAFLAWHRQFQLETQQRKAQSQQRVLKPHLLVVPASTLANWTNEFARFCPSFRLRVYHGSQEERRVLRRELKKRFIPNGEVDVIVSTYTIFERESGKDDRAFLHAQSFDYLVLDEAHCIKNADSSRYLHLDQLRTKHRLLLSGTPVQNDLRELLALLSFLMPAVFGRTNCEILTSVYGWGKGANGSGATIGGGNARNQVNKSIDQVKGMLAPFVLRRLKRHVLDQLSEKSTIVQRLSMTTFQMSVYEDMVASHAARREHLKQASEEAIALDKILDETAVRKRNPVVDATAAAAFAFAFGAKGGAKRAANQQGKSVGSVKETPVPKALMSSTAAVVDLTTPSPPATRIKVTAAGSVANSGVDEGRSPSAMIAEPTAFEVVRASSSERQNVVKAMTAAEAKNLFTALRKAANHPLLLRVRYRDPKLLERIGMVAYNGGYFGSSCNFARVMEEIETFSDFDLHQLCLEYPESLGEHTLDSEMLYDSPKMKYLQELLPKLQREGHRMLIFSQWTRILDLLEVLLNHMQMRFLRLDGSTPVRDRQKLVDRFSRAGRLTGSGSRNDAGAGAGIAEKDEKSEMEDGKEDAEAKGDEADGEVTTIETGSSNHLNHHDAERDGDDEDECDDEEEEEEEEEDEEEEGPIPVFLLSTKAGGLGINLTAADTVILHDLDFNPENDRQAEDRSHRIGQEKPVTVYKLVVSDSVDEDIFDMGEWKKKLSEAVLNDGTEGSSSSSGAVGDETESKGTGKGKRGGRGGKGGSGGDEDEGEGAESMTMISRILQKALSRKTNASCTADASSSLSSSAATTTASDTATNTAAAVGSAVTPALNDKTVRVPAVTAAMDRSTGEDCAVYGGGSLSGKSAGAAETSEITAVVSAGKMQHETGTWTLVVKEKAQGNVSTAPPPSASCSPCIAAPKVDAGIDRAAGEIENMANGEPVHLPARGEKNKDKPMAIASCDQHKKEAVCSAPAPAPAPILDSRAAVAGVGAGTGMKTISHYFAKK